MKSRIEINRTWQTAFLAPLAEAEGWSEDMTARVKVALAKEVDWALRMVGIDLEANINLRIDKIAALTEFHGSLAAFDNYAEVRSLFYTWLLT